MRFGQCFDGREVCTVSDVFREGMSEGWGFVLPGLVVGPVCWSEEVCMEGAEATGWEVPVEGVSELGGIWLWRTL